MHVYAHTRTQVHTCMHTCAHIHTHMYPYTEHMHTYRSTRAHACTHMHTHRHMCAHRYIGMYAYMLTHVYMFLPLPGSSSQQEACSVESGSWTVGGQGEGPCPWPAPVCPSELPGGARVGPSSCEQPAPPTPPSPACIQAQAQAQAFLRAAVSSPLTPALFSQCCCEQAPVPGPSHPHPGDLLPARVLALGLGAGQLHGSAPASAPALQTDRAIGRACCIPDIRT